jgi:chromosome segregation protein
MHLKKLIVSGFKSFADKVTLHFDEGITGIVGPNGSGKSNVIDAVRWVMGEQNAKHLRGEVATDIIFAGSDKRKPLGMAEVTLVFDNRDGSSFCPPEYRHEPEIAVSRRLYIDGEREYFINRKPCRLKDIVGFFATTGLGGRSYSMIQQGQVDRILNAKPEDVREILEEAAGTLIFKARRQAAQKHDSRQPETHRRYPQRVKQTAR